MGFIVPGQAMDDFDHASAQIDSNKNTTYLTFRIQKNWRLKVP